MTAAVPSEQRDDRTERTRPRVLVTRARDRATPLLERLRETGIHAVAAPVIEREPVDAGQIREIAHARGALSRGEYEWVAVTSVNAVDTLLGPQRSTPGGRIGGAGELAHSRARWACVGPATQAALAAHGIDVDLVPDRMNASGLVDAFPSPPAGAPGPGRRVLLPLGDLAAPTLADGLRAKGWEPHVVTAYRTVARDLPQTVVEQAKGAGYDVVVVASGSAARQVAEQLGPQRVVTIGDPSAHAAREAGHDVVAVAAAPTDEALATAVVQALGLRA